MSLSPHLSGLALLLVSQPATMYHLSHSITSYVHARLHFASWKLCIILAPFHSVNFLHLTPSFTSGALLARKRTDPEGVLLVGKRNLTEGFPCRKKEFIAWRCGQFNDHCGAAASLLRRALHARRGAAASRQQATRQANYSNKN